MGFEPTTSALRKPCSTTELPWPKTGSAGLRRRTVANRRRARPSPIRRSRARVFDGSENSGTFGAVHYLVDGYNAAHWLARDPDTSAAQLRDLLIRTLATQVPRDAESVRIFWDVRRPDPSIPANTYLDWCTMHNVPDADAAIIDTVYASKARATLVVVSRDREVTGRSGQLGAKIMGPRDLFSRR